MPRLRATEILNPFTVLIDSREQAPFSFRGLHADADRRNLPLVVATEWKCLGRCGGDYSIKGFEDRVRVERKSVEDCQSTILGWDSGDGAAGRRTRFEEELANLAAMEWSAVIVEGTFDRLLETAPAHGKKTADENRKILHRSVVAWQAEFTVAWFFCDSRALAEVTCFRFLERWWKKVGRFEGVAAQAEERPVSEVQA